MPSVGQSGRRRLVDDIDDVDTGDLARILRGFAAGVVEVIRHRDDGVADLADALFGILLELLEDQGRKKLRRDLAAVEHPLELFIPHVALDALHHVIGVFHGRPLAVGTDDHVPALGQQD